MIVPILTMALNIPIQFAIGSSLVSIVINACTATGIYIRSHMTNLKLGFLLSTMLIPGAIVGALLGANMPAQVLSIIFSLLLLYVGYSMIPKKPRILTAAEMEAERIVTEKAHAPHAWLDDSYYDPAVKEEISYQVHRPVLGMVTSFFGGTVSSMLGVGGGIINVPVMSQLMKIPIKATIATSSLLLVFTTMTGSLIYAYHGYVVPYIVAPLCIGVYIGARLGAAVAHRARGPVLTIVFAILIVLTAALMILRALHIFGG
jgi:uncharacterized membrane protein YfcA